MKTVFFLWTFGLCVGIALFFSPTRAAWPKSAILMCEKFANTSAYGTVMEGNCNFWLMRDGKNVCLRDPDEDRSVMKAYCVPYVYPEKSK